MEHNLDSGAPDTQGSARAFSSPGESRSRAKGGSMSRQEVMVLKAQLEDCDFDLHRAKCRWAAAVRSSNFTVSKLEEVSHKYQYAAAESKRAIEKLETQLDQARNNETKAYLEEIQQLKFELEEARIDRINSAHRLSLADRIMSSYHAELEELRKENTATRSALERAEEETASLRRALQSKKEDMDEILKNMLGKVESLIEKRSRTKRCCLLRCFT